MLGYKYIVIKRKRRKKKPVEVLTQSRGMKDISHDSEKAKCPVDFQRISYSRVLSAVPLWENVNIPVAYLQEHFGEPTRIHHGIIEWAVKILPSKHTIKIVVTPAGTHIYGYNRIPQISKWVDRLIAG